MNPKAKIFITVVALATAVGVGVGVKALLTTSKATNASTWSIYTRNSDSTLAQVARQTYANTTAKAHVTAVIKSNRASDSLLIWQINFNGITPPPVNPGGTPSQPITYNNVTGKKITGLSFDGAKGSVNLFTLNNCTNDTITLCRFSNTNGNSITLFNCKGIIIRYNFFTMVNFGVHAESCQGTKVEYNQGLNLWAPIKYNNNFAHWVQFHNCNSGGQSISYNKFESDANIAVHPHDAISIDACSGVAKDSIMIVADTLLGGQITAWPTSGDTGGGIMAPDESGNFYVVRKCVMVNPGCAAIQCVGTGSGIMLDGNIIYNNVANPVSAQGLTILGSHSSMTVKNMCVWWLNKSKQAIQRSDGQTGLWFGGKTTLPGVTLTNNNWLDVSLNASIIKQPFITYK